MKGNRGLFIVANISVTCFNSLKTVPNEHMKENVQFPVDNEQTRPPWETHILLQACGYEITRNTCMTIPFK